MGETVATFRKIFPKTLGLEISMNCKSGVFDSGTGSGQCCARSSIISSY